MLFKSLVSKKFLLRGDRVDVKVWKTEFGARVTGAGYGYGVLRQATDRSPNSAVVMRNCSPSIPVHSWKDVNNVLTKGKDISMNPDTAYGVLIGLTRRLPEKCLLVANAPTLRDARLMMTEARKRLGHRAC